VARNIREQFYRLPAGSGFGGLVAAHQNRLWHRKTSDLGWIGGCRMHGAPETFIYRLTPSTFSAASMTGVFKLAWQ
jgi:hypothetical protein